MKNNRLSSSYPTLQKSTSLRGTHSPVNTSMNEEAGHMQISELDRKDCRVKKKEKEKKETILHSFLQGQLFSKH